MIFNSFQLPITFSVLRMLSVPGSIDRTVHIKIPKGCTVITQCIQTESAGQNTAE